MKDNGIGTDQNLVVLAFRLLNLCDFKMSEIILVISNRTQAGRSGSILKSRV